MKNLYEQLDNCTYILNNSIEKAVCPDENYELYENLSEWNRNAQYNQLVKYSEFSNLYNQKEWEKIESKH